MDQFFSEHAEHSITKRVQDVIDQLGRTLLDLRVDTLYSGSGEVQSADTDAFDLGKSDRVLGSSNIEFRMHRTP